MCPPFAAFTVASITASISGRVSSRASATALRCCTVNVSKSVSACTSRRRCSSAAFRARTQLTEERRKELVKLVKGMAEEGRVSVRNIRRDAMKNLEELVKQGDAGDDEERAAEGRVQKLTDEHVGRIDELVKRKESDIMEV